jgi:DNA-binding winged helix-turn-helix (wHTH) protein/TolB-like protein/Tfp pilus assembly protein PilF
MNSKNGHLREFGKFRLDAEKRVLWFEEKPVNLALKEIEMLCVLTERGGEVVTKGELLERVWRDSFVEESNLSRHVYVLRKTFKDLGETDLIQTVPRRGYRFAGEVREIPNGEIVIEKHTRTQTLIEIQEEEKPGEGEKKNSNGGTKKQSNTKNFGKLKFLTSSSSAPLFICFSALLLGVLAFSAYRSGFTNTSAAKIKSLAVLPFKTIDDAKENAHSGLGLTDILVTRLSSIREITVRPTAAVMNFETEDSINAGQKLNADAILEGSIYRAGDKVRVTARLVKIADGATIWSGQFEKLRGEEMQVQNEIALQVTDALRLNLSGDEKNALSKRYTESVDAFELYQKGRFEWNKRSWGAMVEAERLFRNAIDRDPNFALAYVGLADTLLMRSDIMETNLAIAKALELDPNLAEARASRGFHQTFHYWNWQAAEESFKKSIELNPNYATAHHWFAQLLTIEGRHEEAKAEMRRALEINPLSHNFLADLGQIYYFNREYREAENYCRKALEIYPDFVFAHQYLADIYLQTGEFDKAFDEIIKADAALGTFNSESDGVSAERLLSYEKNKEIFQKSGIGIYIKSRFDHYPQEAHAYPVFAKNYAFIGEKEKALDYLEKSFQGRGFLTAFIKADPVFDRLRDEPRYREILRKMNLQ